MSKVRRFFSYDETVSIDITDKAAAIFLGENIGIILTKRGSKDPHILFQLISEDDEYWTGSDSRGGSRTSSGWLDDYIQVLEAAKKWCETKTLPDVYNGIQYGWKFKDGTVFRSLSDSFWKR